MLYFSPRLLALLANAFGCFVIDITGGWPTSPWSKKARLFSKRHRATWSRLDGNLHFAEGLALDSLTLIRNLDSLPRLSQNHARCILFGGYCPLLRLVLDERYPLAAGDSSRLPEPLEAAKNGRQGLHVVGVGQVLDEEDLVRRQILVGDHGGSRGVGGLEAGTTRGFRRAGSYILGSTSPLESFLLLESLRSSSLVCVSGPKVSLIPYNRGSSNGVLRELGPTLFGDSPALVLLELVVVAECLDRSIAFCPRHRQAHWLLKEVKALQVPNGSLRGLGAVEDDERLALRPKVRLGDNIDDIAVLGENVSQGLPQRFGLDALFEVLHVYPKKSEGGQPTASHTSGCNDAYVAMGGPVEAMLLNLTRQALGILGGDADSRSGACGDRGTRMPVAPAR